MTLTGKETTRNEEDSLKFSVYTTKQIYMAISKKMPVRFTTFTKKYTQNRAQT